MSRLSDEISDDPGVRARPIDSLIRRRIGVFVYDECLRSVKVKVLAGAPSRDTMRVVSV